MSYFFRIPFAVEGDIAEILQPLQPNGTVSMKTGFTFDYERDPASDPNAKDVPRLETNWLHFVITEAIKQYQTEGSFPFITPEMNGGVAYPYIKTARCRYNGELYESLADNNTALPTDASKWRKISGVQEASKYELGEFYYFRHPILKPGFQPAQGGLLANAATLYPEAWAYLQTVEGQMLCKTEAEWQAMTTAIWHTNADGTKVGWNGIGGAPFYAPNLATGALRLPDLRGMYAEAAGFDTLGVGDVHGDGIRDVMGRIPAVSGGAEGAFVSTGVVYKMEGAAGSAVGHYWRDFRTSLVVPAAAKNQVRAYGSLACVYLGLPAS